jgi:hypothetical protein
MMNKEHDPNEPVAYINLDEKRLEWAVPFEFKSSCFVLGKLPLYLHPPRPEPARKPMTEEEIEAACLYPDEDFMGGFFEGVRFAEKHHGITDADV